MVTVSERAGVAAVWSEALTGFFLRLERTMTRMRQSARNGRGRGREGLFGEWLRASKGGHIPVG